MFGPLISKTITSRANKTGSWRTNSKPKFLQKDCIGCKMCLLICSEACITGDAKNTYICDYEYCKGCGNCAAICPKKDIEMTDEASA